MRKTALAMLLLVVCTGYACNAQTQTTHSPSVAPASPEEACAFIANQMRAAMPQTPTLCSGKQGRAVGYYDLDVFAPTAVLEGSSRRAWSSALFQTIEAIGTAKSLAGACTTITCIVTVSDADMAKHFVRYKTVIDASMLQMQSPYPEFSEHWYLNWWQRLLWGKESDLTENKEGATRLADYACGQFTKVAQKIATQWNIKSPTCSAMLTTDSKLYLVIDFPDSLSPTIVDFQYELVTTLGEVFRYSGYDGHVIFRTPWDDEHRWEGWNGPARIYWMYPIRTLSFAYDEKNSGIRNDNDLLDLLDSYKVHGQAAKNALRLDSNDKFLFRTVAVLSYTINAGATATIDTTDGAEWSTSQEAFERCAMRQGDQVEISTELISGHTVSFDGPPTLTKQNAGMQCKVEASFVRGW